MRFLPAVRTDTVYYFAREKERKKKESDANHRQLSQPVLAEKTSQSEKTLMAM